MKTTNIINTINAKISDIKNEIKVLKTSDSITKSTRNTKLYNKNKDVKVLQLISALINKIDDDEIKLSDSENDTLVLLTTLASERQSASAIDVEENDNILDLMKTYADKKNLLEKLTKACDAKDLFLNFKTGLVEHK